MFNQLKFLPASTETHVVCDYTMNLEQFAVPNIHAMAELSKTKWLQARICRKLGLPLFLQPAWLRNRARMIHPEIVHSHFGNVGARNTKQLTGLGIKHVVTFYGYDVSMLPRQQGWVMPAYLHMFDRIDGVFCEGTFMASEIEKLGCPRDKIIVHHLGVDLNKIPFKPRSWQPGSPLKILLAASFREKKGLPYAIRAIGEVAKKHDVQVTVIGDAAKSETSLNEKRKILEAITEFGLESKVKLLGYQPHSRFFSEAYDHHVFLSPSVTAKDGDCEGGAPVSLIEMAASGMPVVSSVHCDIPSVILDGQTGWLAGERDIESIVSCLESAIASYQSWGELLLRGRKHIEEHYCAVLQGKKLASHYEEISRSS